MFRKEIKKEKWFKKLDKIYLKGKLDTPYDNLFYYYTFIIKRPYIKEKSCTSHYHLFALSKLCGYLGEIIRDLHAILPQDLYENFSNALEDFNNLTEGVDYDNLEWSEEQKLVEKFKQYDEYANNNYKVMEDMLKSCLDKQ